MQSFETFEQVHNKLNTKPLTQCLFAQIVKMCFYQWGGLFITNGTIPMEWIEEKPEKVYEFLEKQRPYVPPGESDE